MIRRPASCLGSDPVKSKLGEVEFLDKCVDHPDRIVLADPVFQAFRKQRALPAIRAFNKALHPIPRKSRRNHIARITWASVFSHRLGRKRPNDAIDCESAYPAEAVISLDRANLR